MVTGRKHLCFKLSNLTTCIVACRQFDSESLIFQDDIHPFSTFPRQLNHWNGYSTRTVAVSSSYRSFSDRYVTLITGRDESLLELVVEGELTAELGLEFFIHLPVSWLTLRGLLMSWGLVPTGPLCGVTTCNWWLSSRGKHGGGGLLPHS